VGESVPYRKHYSKEQAERYARVKEAARRTHRAEQRLARRALARLPPGASVLDLPCGAGRMSLLLFEAGFRVTAADVSPAMADLARERFRSLGLALPVEVRDLEATGYPDGAFDAVFCFRLFHHFPTDALRARAAAELRRIARSHLVVSYLDARSFTSLRRAWQVRRGWKRASKFTQTPSEMRGFFEVDGWRVVDDLARAPFLHSLRVVVVER
jgi:ubiquinone/menaquinone biosynthesis C-methylase UbiE